MDEIKTIMAAVEFSPYSKGIFNYAGQLAVGLDADLVVASIINERDVSAVRRIADMGYEVDGQDYVSGIKRERKNVYEQLAAESSVPDDRIKIVYKVGNPIEELLKIIVAEKIDMVVMGIKGRTDLEYALAGSVAEKMFRRSPVTVVSYRDEATAKRLMKKIRL